MIIRCRVVSWYSMLLYYVTHTYLHIIIIMIIHISNTTTTTTNNNCTNSGVLLRSALGPGGAVAGRQADAVGVVHLV